MSKRRFKAKNFGQQQLSDAAASAAAAPAAAAAAAAAPAAGAGPGAAPAAAGGDADAEKLRSLQAQLEQEKALIELQKEKLRLAEREMEMQKKMLAMGLGGGAVGGLPPAQVQQQAQQQPQQQQQQQPQQPQQEFPGLGLPAPGTRLPPPRQQPISQPQPFAGHHLPAPQRQQQQQQHQHQQPMAQPEAQQMAAGGAWAKPKEWNPVSEEEDLGRRRGTRPSQYSYENQRRLQNPDEDPEVANFVTKSDKQGKMLNNRNLSKEERAALEEEMFGSGHVNAGIDFDQYDNIPVESSGKGIPPVITSFQDAGLSGSLLANIERAHYSHPTPIQRHTIPMAMNGRDIMACAQTGSGKTAAFLFPIITRLETEGKLKRTDVPPIRRRAAFPGALVLAPTRELASQIHDEASRFTYQSKLRCIVCYGGSDMRSLIMELERGADIIVATPGRLIDLMQRGKVFLQFTRFLVLDEADRMLDLGFEPDIRMIVDEFGLPSTEQGRQTAMFSATFPRSIQTLAQDFLGDYIFVTVGRVGSTTQLVTQKVMWVDRGDKADALINLLLQVDGLTLVFVDTKAEADRLHYTLMSRFNIPATSIHGDRSQREREYALAEFQSGRARVLVATDVASRGLDISDVAHVINYDAPKEIDSYVHRVGRTGRAGNKGLATTFLNESDSALAPELVETLEEAGQEVPSWLSSLAERFAARGGRGGGGGGGRGRRGGRRGGRGAAFGGSDFRQKPSDGGDSWGQRQGDGFGGGGGGSGGGGGGGGAGGGGSGGGGSGSSRGQGEDNGASKRGGRGPRGRKPRTRGGRGGGGGGGGGGGQRSAPTDAW